MIVWLNGTFGAGKTTTARVLADLLPGTRQFDPESVGYMLEANLADLDFSDFQQLPPWRALVPATMAQVVALTGQHLIAVQTVLVREYWHELRSGLGQHGLPVYHVLLHADPAVLAARIKADQADAAACQWRLDHLPEFAAARPWLDEDADLIVDSTALTPAEVADKIASAVLPQLRVRTRLRAGP